MDPIRPSDIIHSQMLSHHFPPPPSPLFVSCFIYSQAVRCPAWCKNDSARSLREAKRQHPRTRDARELVWLSYRYCWVSGWKAALCKSCWTDSLGLTASVYPQQAGHSRAPSRDGNHTLLISCPEPLKHFLFQINSNTEEGEPGIRRARRKAEPDLPAELLASPHQKIHLLACFPFQVLSNTTDL